MKRLALLVATLGILATPAAADDEGDGNNRNRPGRDCEGSQDCSTLSPSFEDSPVDRSFIFEPTVCMPFAECRFEDDGQSGEEGA